jgi:hypothetical protein
VLLQMRLEFAAKYAAYLHALCDTVFDPVFYTHENGTYKTYGLLQSSVIILL